MCNDFDCKMGSQCMNEPICDDIRCGLFFQCAACKFVDICDKPTNSLNIDFAKSVRPLGGVNSSQESAI